MGGPIIGMFIGFALCGVVWAISFICDNPLKHDSAMDPRLWPHNIGEYNKTYKFNPPRNWRG